MNSNTAISFPFPVIILAGGFGTRLKNVINDLPKPMAMINGMPFLHYLFKYLAEQKIRKVILSVGYKATVIEGFFGEKYLDIEIVYSREVDPLGTGGGIKKALDHVSDYSFVLNGDTLFSIDLKTLSDSYFEEGADVSVALKPMLDFDRYGAVMMEKNRICSFEEKKFVSQGLINGGVYFLQKNLLQQINQESFSFEKEVLEKSAIHKAISGKIFDDYFIDIGIPEDYARAQIEFKNF